MTDTTCYDALAARYHLLYADWEWSIARQGAALAGLLGELGVCAGARVHDAACGIGTQTIGLAQRGYRLSASDLSPGAAARARDELARRGATADVRVADMRALPVLLREPIDAVIACDNAVPHLLTDDEILKAFRGFRAVLRPGGALVVSVRDYAAMARQDPDVHPYGLRRVDGRRVLAVQVWEWDDDGRRYDVRIYVTEEEADGLCTTTVHRSRYYAVSIARLTELALQAGFRRVERRDGVLFQPVLVASVES
ncbi:class I SAM-dependent methyltransferase [Gemmatirosa kalamazoonensis]|nr:class I SAM-dependent methyltransferase [Gemmatirosa kalamazoonensis]